LRSLSGVWRQACVRPTLSLVVKLAVKLVVIVLKLVVKLETYGDRRVLPTL
jgi:hypothetical protein